MGPDPTDADLIRRSLERPEAFSDVFARHAPEIHRYLARRIGATDADELTSETFVTAFRRRADYDQNRESALPWLYGIAANHMRSKARKERRGLIAYAKTGIDPLESTGLPTDAIEARVDAVRFGPALARALAGLKPVDREVLLLFAWAELSYEQIAEAMDVPVGTVRSRLSRARARVVEQLEAGGQEKGEMTTGSEATHG